MTRDAWAHPCRVDRHPTCRPLSSIGAHSIGRRERPRVMKTSRCLRRPCARLRHRACSCAAHRTCGSDVVLLRNQCARKRRDVTPARRHPGSPFGLGWPSRLRGWHEALGVSVRYRTHYPPAAATRDRVLGTASITCCFERVSGGTRPIPRLGARQHPTAPRGECQQPCWIVGDCEDGPAAVSPQANTRNRYLRPERVIEISPLH